MTQRIRVRSTCKATLVAVAMGAAPAYALTQDEIIGTWRILSYVHKDGTDEISHPMGDRPQGYLIIGSDHRCTVVIAAENRKPAQSEKDYATLAKTMIAYSAPFTDESDGRELKLTLRPDVSWSPSMTGANVVRLVSLEGNELLVRSAPSPHGIFTARFERAR